MALLWQASPDPDDLRIAVKRLEHAVEDELRQLVQADGESYLAVAHSTLSRGPVPALGQTAEGPVRITTAVDHRSESGVLRHPNGATQWFGEVDLPIITLVRSLLWLAPAA